MAQTALAKQTHALITLFTTLFTSRYGQAPRLNRYRERWGFQSMIEDLGYDRSKEVVEYYFKTPRAGHPVNQLLFNYDKLDERLTESAEDEVKRTELRKQTEERVRAWEIEHGN